MVRNKSLGLCDTGSFRKIMWNMQYVIFLLIFYKLMKTSLPKNRKTFSSLYYVYFQKKLAHTISKAIIKIIISYIKKEAPMFYLFYSICKGNF